MRDQIYVIQIFDLISYMEIKLLNNPETLEGVPSIKVVLAVRSLKLNQGLS